MVILTLERDNQRFQQLINIEETISMYLKIKKNLKSDEHKIRFLLNNELYWIFPFIQDKHKFITHKKLISRVLFDT